MYCPKCGRELQKGWNHCPYCMDTDNTAVSDNFRRPAKEDLEKELQMVKENTGGVILMHGTGAIEKDLLQVLHWNEKLICMEFAHRKGIAGFLRNGKAFRNYMVCTEERIIYFEKARMILSLMPFLHKVISVPYNMVQEVRFGKQIGIFSGYLEIETQDKKYSFQVSSSKAAEKLRTLIIDKVRC